MVGRICSDDTLTFGSSISHDNLVLHERKIMFLVTSIQCALCNLYKMLYHTLFSVSYITEEPKIQVHNPIYSAASV